jgi:hypothetical protein
MKSAQISGWRDISEIAPKVTANALYYVSRKVNFETQKLEVNG